ncbi:MAG: efflux RND transporter permease subunit [Halomonas sp.]|uniref:efflux RND transporter permease subunit n=1 Tax=Halomonas sp. TaxID=1486246 RepID=UPI0019E3E061|nr:efflux RND transporter permease subunit [Halomonas sp.]MBE0489428.1 efflux RND transporter permease subunit [Halomonas sp.]
MKLAVRSIRSPVVVWLLILGCLIGGFWGLSSVGRLEDPGFTLKTALVFTNYPGASAEVVEREVTEVLETAIQRMPQLDFLVSESRPGISQITVEIQDTYGPREMAQVWDELRRRLSDAQADLPSGVLPPVVNDDFGDVYGLYYAVTAPEFSAADQREIARLLQRELLTLSGVAKVETLGLPEEVVQVEVPSARLRRLGLPPDQVLALLSGEGAILPEGSLRAEDARLRLNLAPGYDTVAGIEALRLGQAGGTEQISLLDIATVRRLEAEQPRQIIRHNGERAFTIGVSVIQTENVVDVGERVEARLDELRANLPTGVTLSPIYEQHRVVDEAVASFINSLALSVAIVIAALMLTMGLRAGIVVGATLGLTVLGTFFFMSVFGIEIERISLGALIIAMGMLVDNAIVIAEGMLVGMARGQSAEQAAEDAENATGIPLLGATVIGIMAFSGIGLSPDATGEFLFSLFAVIAISLLLSWLLALTVTPWLAAVLMRVPRSASPDVDPYRGPLYRGFAWCLQGTLRARWLTLATVIVVVLLSFASFGLVKQAFFPVATTPLFYVHYQLPRGADINATARDMQAMEAMVRADERVTDVTTLIGQGASRFMLTYQPEQPDPSYGQLIVRVSQASEIPGVIDRLDAMHERFPQGQMRFERIVFGPPTGSDVEARLSGADPLVLRELAAEVRAQMVESGALIDLRTDWRERELVLEPEVDEARMRVAGVGRQAIADTLQYASSGLTVGTFRDGDSLLPILVRVPGAERQLTAQAMDQSVWSAAANAYVPMSQVVADLSLVPKEAAIFRRDRARTLTVMANAGPGYNADSAFRAVRDSIEALTLPDGYQLEWGGEYESASEAQASLGAQLPLGFLIMFVISVLLFNKLRQPLILWLVVPMSFTGMALGLLVAGLPFTFLALLGLLSLSGMVIKNAIILVEEIDARIAAGAQGVEAVVTGTVSRLRPVLLAAGTTIAGMIPLLADAFFASMAVTIMGGLAFASVLTLVVVPVIYALMFRIRPNPLLERGAKAP